MDFSQIQSQLSLNIDLSIKHYQFNRLKFASVRVVTDIFQEIEIGHPSPWINFKENNIKDRIASVLRAHQISVWSAE